MDKGRAKIVVSSAVESLGPVEKANLLYHHSLGTGVVAGEAIYFVWVNKDGAGCPVMLSCYRELPPGPIVDDGKSPHVRGFVAQVAMSVDRASGQQWFAALSVLTPEEAWEAVYEGCR